MPGVWSAEVLLQRIRSHPSDAACVIGALEIGLCARRKRE